MIDQGDLWVALSLAQNSPSEPCSRQSSCLA